MKKYPSPHTFFLWILGCFFLSFSGCGGGGGASPSAGEPGLGPISANCLTAKGSGTASDNTLPIYLGTAGDNSSSICGSAINNPCTDVTICSPSGSNCQTISNILVDTGSSGLRVFRSVLNNTAELNQVASPAGTPVGECAAFGNGAYGDWGPLVYAQVTLSGEPSVTLPIQLIDPTYAGQYTSNGSPQASNPSCRSTFTPDTTPENASFNGILGVGLSVHWCGSDCATTVNNGVYFSSCSGSGCSGTSLGNCEQDQNPVPLYPADHQGVLLSFPSITYAESSAKGSLILGIGSQTDNTPSSDVKAYQANSLGNFQTTFNGSPYTSYIDSGSDGYFFYDSPSSITNSGSPDYYYNPTSPQPLSATISGATQAQNTPISFTIETPPAQGSGFSEGVIPDIGFYTTGVFDWGLPFFFLKRNVYVGINRQSTTSLGTGPFWAF